MTRTDRWSRERGFVAAAKAQVWTALPGLELPICRIPRLRGYTYGDSHLSDTFSFPLRGYT
jgi:hypothetical protein